MVLAARALAFLRGRDYVLATDVRDLARDVLRHRIVLSYEALAEDMSPDDLMTPILAATPVPQAPLRERTAPAGMPPASPPRVTHRGRDRHADTGAPAPAARWRVVRRLDGQLQGDYRSLFRGSGAGPSTNLREYEPGDDLRHIEWNVTARMDTPYVREYIEDREVTAWLLLDLFGVDGVRTGGPSRRTSSSPRSRRPWPWC